MVLVLQYNNPDSNHIKRKHIMHNTIETRRKGEKFIQNVFVHKVLCSLFVNLFEPKYGVVSLATC